jgi:hypothetical protein
MWESKISRVLEVGPQMGLPAALERGLTEAGITCSPARVGDRGQHPRFAQGPQGQHPRFVLPRPDGGHLIRCGERDALPSGEADGHILCLVFPLGQLARHQVQCLRLQADGWAQATIVWQALVCSPRWLPPRPVMPKGTMVVRFATEQLAARDKVITRFLGVNTSVATWLEELFASSGISIVSTTPQASWRSSTGVVSGPYAHADQQVTVLQTSNPSVLIIWFWPKDDKDGIELGLVVMARSTGGAEIIAESVAYGVGSRWYPRHSRLA